MRPALPLVILLLTGPAYPQAPAEVGVDEKLGEIVPLGEIVLVDEDGSDVSLGALADRPIVLTLVFFRCAGLCTPLLNEVARVTDLGSLEPGKDFRLVSVSFDTRDTPELARTKKANQIARMERKRPSPDAWRFLTGDQETIDRLTRAVGFHYVVTEDGQSFNHPAVLIFISKDGKICRYLHGTSFNPIDLRMAVEDTSAGHPRPIIRKLTRLCFAYDPVGQSYVVKVNRIILGITGIFALIFVGYLLLRRRGENSGKARETAASGAAGEER